MKRPLDNAIDEPPAKRVRGTHRSRRKKKKKIPVVALAISGSRTNKNANPLSTSEPDNSFFNASFNLQSRELREELVSKRQVIQTYSDVIQQLKESLTCRICLQLLYKPYALAPCGHIACYSCLVNWFTSLNGLPRPQNFYNWKKTCPHCRVVVRHRPVEMFLIKGMITLLDDKNLLEYGPPDLPVEGADPPMQDPWDGLFRLPCTVPSLNHLPVDEVGMLDLEDGGIYRCIECMHEIWEGICSACSRIYPGHRQSLTGNDDTDHTQSPNTVNLSFADEADSEADRHSNADSVESAVSEDGYESSFIDDDGDDDRVVWSDNDSNHEPSSEAFDRYGLHLHSDTDCSVNQDRLELESTGEEDSDQEDQCASDDSGPPAIRRRIRPVFIDDDGDDDDEGQEDN